MRKYSNTAVTTELASGAADVDTTIDVSDTTGFPVTTPYTLSIDAENASKELVEVTGVAGTTLTVTRGIDGTSAVSHSLGAEVRHDHSARDFREPQEHIAATTDVHGVSGDLVGTASTQVLTNKNLEDATNVFPASLARLTSAQTLTNKTIALGSNTISGTLAQFNTALTDADFATLAAVQTLTNKAIALGSNTLSGSLAEFNAALTGADFATLADTQTLSNKTLTAPTITDPTITGGASVAGGLTVDEITLAGSVAGVYQAYTPTITGVTYTLTYARYTEIGDMAHGQLKFVFTAAPTDEVTVSLPVPAANYVAGDDVVYGDGIVRWDAGPGRPYQVVLYSTTDASTFRLATDFTDPPNYIKNGQGWTADDTVTVNFMYEKA